MALGKKGRRRSICASVSQNRALTISSPRRSRFGSDGSASLFGSFYNKVRANGPPFPSDWALVTEARNGKLVPHHFHEDTDTPAQAMRDQAAS